MADQRVVQDVTQLSPEERSGLAKVVAQTYGNNGRALSMVQKKLSDDPLFADQMLQRHGYKIGVTSETGISDVAEGMSYDQDITRALNDGETPKPKATSTKAAPSSVDSPSRGGPFTRSSGGRPSPTPSGNTPAQPPQVMQPSTLAPTDNGGNESSAGVGVGVAAGAAAGALGVAKIIQILTRNGIDPASAEVMATEVSRNPAAMKSLPAPIQQQLLPPPDQMSPIRMPDAGAGMRALPPPQRALPPPPPAPPTSNASPTDAMIDDVMQNDGGTPSPRGATGPQTPTVSSEPPSPQAPRPQPQLPPTTMTTSPENAYRYERFNELMRPGGNTQQIQAQIEQEVAQIFGRTEHVPTPGAPFTPPNGPMPRAPGYVPPTPYTGLPRMRPLR